MLLFVRCVLFTDVCCLFVVAMYMACCFCLLDVRVLLNSGWCLLLRCAVNVLFVLLLVVLHCCPLLLVVVVCLVFWRLLLCVVRRVLVAG